MKLAIGTLFLGILAASASAHYECTPQQAFDVLFNNATTSIIAERLLISLKSGVAKLRTDLNQTSAEEAAQRIMDRYRNIISYLPKNLAVGLPQI
ncbi:hypothetical protein GGH94_004189 [Coemansia aciculifera]|uniref:Uncharacterized protein n=2 Tax=Coemansia TaxID=4863 RepID=A0A9W8GNF2_9FUNG|nr:hypothetical protein GGI19_006350 [Coemansia pectinata]KAJ2862569.1 hypothetical protein GGH94_004189 [Coemansia aciculifera]KAJ2872301.1 hypothetical protein GGH93_004134 [Coemansia aciculifera]KAJ2887300.1 hypothetical protein H4R27_000098 [Coemansia aciculifera]